MKKTLEIAQILTEALPYIKKYKGQVVVVKYGGAAMQSEELKQAVMSDVVLLHTVGVKVVVVHGGGKEISCTLGKMAIPTHFVGGLRQTDAEVIKVVEIVLAGKVNKDLVSILENAGGKAMGLSGVDGNMLRVRAVNEELGFVGEVVSVDTTAITDALDSGYIPVISTLGGDADGNIYNVNADDAAGAIAGALKADGLITLTDIRGILRDKDDESTLISVIKEGDVDGLIESGVVSGGMIPKVRSCVEALSGGVDKVFVIDGRIPHSLLLELFSDDGIGTMFTK